MNLEIILLLSLVVFCSHFIGALTGFGCTILAIPFTISLIGPEGAKPVLIILALIQCGVVVIQTFKDINWKELKKIVLLVSLGMPIGILAYSLMSKKLLVDILSIFMILISIKGFLELKGYEFKAPKDYILNIILFIGGIIHGAFVSGGPLIMVYSTEKIKDKNVFRATMCMIWIILNLILMTQEIVGGNYTKDVVIYTVLTMPSLIFGVLLGSKLSSKVNQRLFSYIIYTVLVITALFNFL